MLSMTIGELSRHSGLAVSAIRFYQRRGLLPARVAGNGWQRYGADVVSRLELIHLAKSTGFTLDEIAALLGALDADGSLVPAWRALATAKLTEIQTQMTRLDQMRSLLSEGLDCSCLTLPQVDLVPTALAWAADRSPR